MFSSMIKTIVCILIAIIIINYLFEFFNIKEGLWGDKTSAKDKKKQQQQQAEEAIKKQQQQVQEAVARSKLTPAQINSNNLKYIQRSQSNIKRDVEDIKNLINEASSNIQKQCCSINQKFKRKACKSSGGAGKHTEGCTIKDPCKPCTYVEQKQNPSSCCLDLSSAKK